MPFRKASPGTEEHGGSVPKLKHHYSYDAFERQLVPTESPLESSRILIEKAY
jgi:hypothetical protein